MAPSRLSPPSALPGGLTAKQLSTFWRDGYLILPDYLDAATCSTLLRTTHTLLRDFPLANHPMTRFVTGTDSDGDASSFSAKHVGDEYFLSSGDQVRFFFEDAAFDSTSGELVKPKERAINKIGHNLHGLEPAFGAVSHAGAVGARNAAIARSLGYADPRLLQSMIICKQPEIGGAVPPHQDSTFLYTRRPSAVGFWIALEDATRENGCLSFAPGSHRRAPVTQRFVRMPEEGGTGFEPVEGEESRWPRGLEREDDDDDDDDEKEEGHKKKEEEYVLGEVKAGTLVLIHGNLLHKSEMNLSQKGRIIYTFHVIEGTEQYDDRNWLQIPGGPEAFTKLDGSVAVA